MYHVGKRISVLFAFADHAGDIVPRITVVFHSLDYLDDSIYIGNVLLNVPSLQNVNILLLLKFFYSLILVLFDLVILFPCNSFNVFFFLMLAFLVFQEILTDSFIKSLELFAQLIWVLAIFVRRELKVIYLVLVVLQIHLLSIK